MSEFEPQNVTRTYDEATANEKIKQAYAALPENVKAPKASKWTRAGKLTWDAWYNGDTLSARKVEGQWNVFLWNEMGEDWDQVLIFAKNVGIRRFWKFTTVWLAENLAATYNPLEGYNGPADGEEPASP